MTDAVQALRFGDDGLICAVAQQHDTREVLMVAWMDAEAVRRTLASGRGTYWSRSRREYWVKGETSGNVQRVLEIRHDCDADTLLLLVDQTGPACHTGSRSCFDDRVVGVPAGSSAAVPGAVPGADTGPAPGADTGPVPGVVPRAAGLT